MYALNPESAKAADNAIGTRITDTGKYVGKFTRAENIKSSKGTLGIEFSFVTDSGQSADFLQIWTKGPDGKKLFGFNQLMAIMTCMKVKNLTPSMATVEKWDRDAGRTTQQKAEVFQELMGKPIGLLLQKEHYTNNNGQPKERMLIQVAFEASTGFVASEILDKAIKPEKMEKALASLKDRYAKGYNAGSSHGGDYGHNRFDSQPTGPAPNGFDDGFDSDIPF